jgi:hypothetical protein
MQYCLNIITYDHILIKCNITLYGEIVQLNFQQKCFKMYCKKLLACRGLLDCNAV